MLNKDIDIDIDSLNTESSPYEILGLMLFVAIVEFIFGFMVGVSY